jgi:hypothetical protein
MWWGNGAAGAMSPELMAFLPIIASIVVGWFVNMGVTGWLASRKGRDGGLWVVAAIFLGPVALLVVVLAPRKPAPAGGPAAALAPVPRVRLQDDSVLELELGVPERIALLPGELTPRVEGRPGFRLTRSNEWRWGDGRRMAADERAQVLVAVRSLGPREGWNLTLHAADAGIASAQ